MYLRLTLAFFGTLLGLGSPVWGPQIARLDENPRVVETKVPPYPAIVRSAHVSGTVVVETQINSDGKVTAVEAISGPPLLRVVSKDAALGWRFGGSPNAGSIRRVQLTFDFIAEIGGCDQVVPITPYHLRIRSGPPPETVSYIPDKSKSYCNVHGVSLLRDKVEVIYGLFVFRRGYEQAEKKHFPNANSEAFGGCLVATETCDGKEVQLSPRYAEVLYCPKCRRAERDWQKKHPRKDSQQ
jgi:Gram-negative bacterial TonB protein C-terminal